MKSFIAFFLFITAIFAHPSAILAQTPYQQPGYSILATSKAQFKSDMWIDGFLKPQKAISLPRYTTTARNAISSPSESMFIYNSTLDSLQYYHNGWQSLTSNASNLWETVTFGDLEILVPKSGPNSFSLQFSENIFSFNEKKAILRNDTIQFQINGSLSYQFPADTGTVSQVLGITSNPGTGETQLGWLNGITLQDAISAQSDTTGLATEMVALTVALATIESLVVRVAQLENRLSIVGILPE